MSNVKNILNNSSNKINHLFRPQTKFTVKENKAKLRKYIAHIKTVGNRICANKGQAPSRTKTKPNPIETISLGTKCHLFLNHDYKCVCVCVWNGVTRLSGEEESVTF